MTNIMAYVNDIEQRVDPTLFGDDISFNGNVGVVMADGLGSNGQEVTRHNQKIFPIGSNFVLGTGALDFMYYVAKHLAKHDKLHPAQLARKILALRKDLTFQGAEQLNFIVAGMNAADAPEIYHVQLNRLASAQRKEGHCFDGSGAPFVYKALKRDSSLGLLRQNKFMTLADITSMLFDLSYVAMDSAGVNDELQFGFLTQHGTATLMHPAVWHESRIKEYCTGGKFDTKKAAANQKTYDQLWHALVVAFNVQRSYNAAAQTYLHVPTDDLATTMLELKKEHRAVMASVDNILWQYIVHANK